MPAKLRAGAGIPYILEGDRELENPPKMLLRVLSVAEYDELHSYRGKPQTHEIAIRILELVLSGWHGIEVEFSAKAAYSYLTPYEHNEIVGEAYSASMLTPDQKKKFESQRKSETETSAKTAEQPAEAT